MIRVVPYGTGGIVHWPVISNGGGGARGMIGDMSKRSRIRLAWMLSNAPRPWGMMTTHTFPRQPKSPKTTWKRFVRLFLEEFGPGWQWAWLMEFQTRGVIHFHCFFERELLWSLPWHPETVTRDGIETDLVRGELEEWFVDTWLECVGTADMLGYQVPNESKKTKAFNWGGICEVLRTPDAAGRYAAKEASKRAQKKLPDGVDACGRWFWISPAGKPQSSGSTIQLRTWPFGNQAYRYVFDLERMRRQVYRETPLTITKGKR